MSTTCICAPARLAVCALATVLLCTGASVWAQTSPAAAAEPSLPYTVKAKDKLIVLSKSLLVDAGSWSEVARFNQLKNPDVIASGQVIKIPLRLLKPLLANGKVINIEGDVKMGTQPLLAGAALPEMGRACSYCPTRLPKLSPNADTALTLPSRPKVAPLPHGFLALSVWYKAPSTPLQAKPRGVFSLWKSAPRHQLWACAARSFAWPMKTQST
jgi:LysM repeat protein